MKRTLFLFSAVAAALSARAADIPAKPDASTLPYTAVLSAWEARDSALNAEIARLNAVVTELQRQLAQQPGGSSGSVNLQPVLDRIGALELKIDTAGWNPVNFPEGTTPEQMLQAIWERLSLAGDEQSARVIRESTASAVRTAELLIAAQKRIAELEGTTPPPPPPPPTGDSITIQAESYARAQDTEAANLGGNPLRNGLNGVDLLGSGTQIVVGYWALNEWLEYDVTNLAAANYTLTLRVSNQFAGATVGVSVDGTAKATVTIPNTGSYTTFQDVTISLGALSAGNHVVRLTGTKAASGGWIGDFDWLRLAKTTTTGDAGAIAPKFGTHWMLAISGETKGLEPEAETIRRGEAYKQTLWWLHADGPLSGNEEDAKYGQRMLAMLDAMKGTQSYGIPGCHGNWITWRADAREKTLDFFQRTLSHERVFRPNGKPVIAFYDYREETAQVIAWVKERFGDNFELWANPAIWDDHGWLSARGLPSDRQRVYTKMDDWISRHPEVHGVINFAVDLGVANGTPEAEARAIERNRNLIRACKAAGVASIAGWNARYYNETFTDAQIRAICEDTLAEGPNYIFWTTANDVVEGSYVNNLGKDFVTLNGERWVYIPPRGTFRLGDNVPYPLKDQTRFSVLVQPYVDRFVVGLN